MKVVYAFVVLDLPHWGHFLLLKRAKNLGDFLVVGVLDNDTVESYKRRPIMSLEERMKVASRIKDVDLVIPQFEKYPLETLKLLHRIFPKDKLICVHGSDWKQEGFQKVTEYLQSVGGELRLLPYYTATSTTKRIDEMAKRYMDEARKSP
ncbi:Glycerol-3-phosphate cytidylyltransferase [subsurface metagenome]